MRGAHLLILIFVALLLALQPPSTARRVPPGRGFTVDPPEPKLIDLGSGYVVTARGMSIISAPGYPMLPFKTVGYALNPWEAVSGYSVKAFPVKTIILDKGVLASHPTVLGEGGSPAVSTVGFHGRFVTYAGVEWFRALRLAVFKVFPVWYYPENRTLKIFRIHVSLSLGQSEDMFVEGSDELTRELIREGADPESDFWIPNGGSTVLAYRVTSVSRSTPQQSLPPGSYKLVAIVPGSWRTAAERYVEWKRKMGIPSYLATTDWIYSRYAGRDEAWRIREFIKDAYNTWHIEYVVLLGDVDYVPTRYIRNPDSDEGGWFSDGTYKPTDWYYAGLDVDWYDSSTGEYGDDSQHVDWVPEVTVGRIPAHSSSELNTYINKLIRYTRDASTSGSWYSRVMFVGAGLEEDSTGRDFKEYLRHHVSGFSPYTYINLYNTCGQSCGTTNVTRTNFSSGVEDGRLYINIFSHGSTDAAWEKHTSLGGWQTYARSDDARTFTNGLKEPLIFALACLTNAFDANEHGGTLYYGGRSLGEDFIRNGNGGAIVYIGWARTTWAETAAVGDDGYSQTMDYKFWQYFFHSSSEKYIPGMALFRAKTYYGTHYGGPGAGEIRKKVYTSLHLLGDPALDVWSSKPSRISGSYPSEVGYNVRVTVHTEPGATVVLYTSDWSYYEVRKADSSGNAEFTSPSKDTYLSIAISKHNRVPFLKKDAIRVVGVRIHVHVTDGKSRDLGGAEVKAYEDGALRASAKTNPRGEATLSVNPNANYVVKVYWLGKVVGQKTLSVGVSDASMEISVPVYSLGIHVMDGGGEDLGGARVVISRGGEVLLNLTTSNYGRASARLYEDEFTLKVYWQGVPVYQRQIRVSGGDRSLDCVSSVYNLTLGIVDMSMSPLPGARIYLIHPNRSRLTLATNATGYLSLPRMAGGLYGLRVYWNSTLVLSRDINHNSSAARFLKATVYNFSLRVVDADGRGLEGAKVTISSENLTLSLESGSGGWIRLGPSASTLYTITVQYEYIEVARAEHNLNSSNPINISTEVYTLALIVHDYDGEPLGNAAISLVHPALGPLHFTTNSTGFAGLGRHPVGRYVLKVVWEGIEVYRQIHLLNGSSILDVRCSVYSPTLHTVKFNGAPLGGVALTILHPNGTTLRATTDSGGALRLSQIPGGAYHLAARWMGVTVLDVEIGLKNSSDITLRLGVYDFELWLVDSHGDPVHPVSLSLLSPNGSRAELSSDTGHLFFDDMPGYVSPDHVNGYGLEVEYLGVNVYRGRLVVNGGNLTVTLNVHRVTGIPTTTSGRPLRHARVVVTGASTLSTVSGDNGRFLLRLPPGQYSLYVYWMGREVYSEAIVLKSDRDLGFFTVDVHTLTVKILLQNGRPAQRLNVTIEGEGAVLSLTTGEDGSVTADLVPGRFTVHSTYMGVVVLNRSVEVDHSFTIVLTSLLTPTRIRVVDQYGQPLKHAEVLISKNGSTIAIETGSAGYTDEVVLPRASLDVAVAWMGSQVYSGRFTPSPIGVTLKVPLCRAKILVRDYRYVFGETALGGVQVRVSREGQLVGVFVTDSGGEVLVEQLPRGVYTISVEGNARMVALKIGENTVKIVVDRTALGLPRLHSILLLSAIAVLVIALALLLKRRR